MYRILADDHCDVLREIADFVTRMANAERHHASIVHKGKKIGTAKAEHCARQLDHLAYTIRTQMQVITPGGTIYRADGKHEAALPPGMIPAKQEPLTADEEADFQRRLGGVA